MARKTQGVYKPEITEPWEISRGKIADWRKCEACFWLEKVAGVKQPSTPPFLINSLTDTLLKREMDELTRRAGIAEISKVKWDDNGYPILRG